MSIKNYLKRKAEVINQELKDILPSEDEKPAKLHKSMRYSLLAGGKRLRPVLTITTADLIADRGEEALPAACAIELIHSYSLIHDDLPSMDDDEIRRGKPTNHLVFGNGIAILAGDALLTYAFEIMSGLEGFKKDYILQASNELAVAAGNQGMVGGQVADILAEGKAITKEELDYIHRHKTGALLKASVKIGAILAGANQAEIKALTEYAEEIGLAFQIVDDILDIEGDSEKLGKTAGSDLASDKATFPALYGLEEAKKLAKQKQEKAKEALEIFSNDKADLLAELADYIVERSY